MAAPQCTKCSRLNLDHTCQAFPCGVPDEIFLGGFDHRSPYPGDGGIIFMKSANYERGGTCHETSRGTNRESELSGENQSA
jgi:hypothetical protein